ncbi:hypothetical protein [Candidatus Phytoplasma bonamiae]|uniref:Uncharacterized protein n=1 Tax=Candidatus Phytoplasma bonamiae TaxID=2982626 RepID=A0ABT9D605_9MOLU|nr:hypothetical protein ['Bonamia sp.' little leaf phytoplasma]MDO8064256.1 hypothetical protein ['Bonamia sp.' little leaf phytoplasma]
MMSQETYDSICTRIDRDLTKLEADDKDYQQKIADYKIRQTKNNLTQELRQSRSRVQEIERKEESVINEYQTIVKELEKERDKVSDIDKLYEYKAKLEEILENKRENVDIIKEQLKQKIRVMHRFNNVSKQNELAKSQKWLEF